jgi:hypothetical protein
MHFVRQMPAEEAAELRRLLDSTEPAIDKER